MTGTMVTLFDLLRASQDELAAAGVDNPVPDSRLLIAHALTCGRADLLTQTDRVLSAEEAAVIQTLISRRAAREPVSRILGLREFWGLPFGLNEATLDPRPDSETVIETALTEGRKQGSGIRKKSEFASLMPDSCFLPSVLDLGTGSGCLLLALLHEWPQATGLGVDIAPRAIEQAQINARRLGIQDRAAFRVNDWLDDIEETFDVIVCNPPYIAAADIPALMPEVREHDPLAALDGGRDGLDAYRHLIPLLPQRLKNGGWAFFEAGQGQAEAVCGLFREAGFRDIRAARDLGGIERCVAGCYGSPPSRG